MKHTLFLLQSSWKTVWKINRTKIETIKVKKATVNLHQQYEKYATTKSNAALIFFGKIFECPCSFIPLISGVRLIIWTYLCSWWHNVVNLLWSYYIYEKLIVNEMYQNVWNIWSRTSYDIFILWKNKSWSWFLRITSRSMGTCLVYDWWRAVTHVIRVKITVIIKSAG